MWYIGGKKRQSKAIVTAVKTMRYLGGKKRQSKAIVAQAHEYRFKVYAEPFCGAMWSAVAMMKAFPDAKFLLSDVNPYLINMWQAALNGWDPPSHPTEKDYLWYKDRRPVDDPMTGYLGFAWSFGGKFFGGAARSDGKFKGSYRSTMDKIGRLRQCDVELSCCDYRKLKIPNKAMVYLDPPYEGRTPQSTSNDRFDYDKYYSYAENLSDRCAVVTTSFTNPRRWEVLHDYGDTVVRHHRAKPKDGTVELLMKVRKQ